MHKTILIMTKGLPGSGKTTWALEAKTTYEKHGLTCLIISKDDIRIELEKTGWTWSQKRERDVIAIRNARISQAYKENIDVIIIADTNFGKHEAILNDIASQYDMEFRVKDFTHVPVKVCIERDAQRAKPIGAEVIAKMAAQYLPLVATEYVRYVPNLEKPLAIICDLDGTLALHQNRSPYDFAKCETDRVNEPVANIVKLHHINGYKILYVSGRDEWCKPLTENWLRTHSLPILNTELFMRGNHDKRKDNLVKYDLFHEHIRENYNVRFVLDDRDQVVKMWRALGLTCLQVAEGAF